MILWQAGVAARIHSYKVLYLSKYSYSLIRLTMVGAVCSMLAAMNPVAYAQNALSGRGQLAASGYIAEPGLTGWGVAQTYPVRSSGALNPSELTAPPAAVEASSGDPIETALAQDASNYGAALPGLPLPGSQSTDGDGDVSDTGPAEVPDRYTWNYDEDRSWPAGGGVSSSSPGLRGAPDLRQVGIATSKSALPWSVGASSWSFTGDIGPRISIGSQQVGNAEWARSAKLGGINIADSDLPGESAKQTWSYTVALGAIDGAPAASSGDLAYGSGAGYAAMNYGLSPAFKLESQVEMAPSMMATGLGGEYDTGWGAWSAGVARASGSVYKGWRYQTAYTFDVMEDIKVTWLNESTSEGFADLSSYESGPAASSASRQKWSAMVPTRRWGNISGGYEVYNPKAGDQRRSFGLTQQFWYSPNLQIGLTANHEMVSGDYDVGIRFSVPVF